MRMILREDLVKELGEDVFACLDRFFCLASAHGVKNVTIDCVTRKVGVELHQVVVDEDTDPESYFLSKMEVCNMQVKANGVFAHWKRKQLVNPTVESYQKLVGKQLEEVLKSNFLVVDEWSCTDDFAKYAGELAQWKLTEREYELRYCLLRKLLNFERGRFIVDESVTGRYLQIQNDKLTREGTKCFFCFVHLCQLVNAAMDQLEKDEDSLSPIDKKLLDRILGYVPKGEWHKPATCENVRLFLSELFENGEFRDFFKGGRAGEDTDRVEVSMANILGYMKSHQLLDGGQKTISTEFFGTDSQVNNINKGMKGNGSKAFQNLIPMLDKYMAKVIV